jgi:hypothetical protein
MLILIYANTQQWLPRRIALHALAPGVLRRRADNEEDTATLRGLHS